MNYLLFDNPQDKNSLSFISKMIRLEIKEVYSPKEKRKIVGWLKGCWEVLKQSHSEDTIICWYDFQAVLCYWISRFTCKNRKIACINLLLKDKDTLKNKVVSWLYKKALKDKNFVASVTSIEYGAHLKNRLGINKELFLLHDVFHDSYIYHGDFQVNPNSVFCGGRNGRDWKFMMDVAREMPTVEFHLVMPENVYMEYKDAISSNIIAKYNLSMNDFLKEMCSCEIVALPLDTEAPAGLIVLFQAAANMKYIITADTMTTREYLSDGRGCLLPNDIAIWTDSIRQKLENSKMNTEASKKLLSLLESECSEKKFADGVELMISNLV